MKSFFMLAVLMFFSSLTSANTTQLEVFSAYKKCVDDIENPLIQTVVRLRDGLYHEDILQVWTQAFIPTKQIDKAYQALLRNDIKPTMNVLDGLRSRLKSNDYRSLMHFIEVKLAKSESSDCRRLPGSIAQQLQNVIIDASLTESELEASLASVKQKIDVQRQMNELGDLLDNISLLGKSLNERLKGTGQ